MLSEIEKVRADLEVMAWENSLEEDPPSEDEAASLVKFYEAKVEELEEHRNIARRQCYRRRKGIYTYTLFCTSCGEPCAKARYSKEIEPGLVQPNSLCKKCQERWGVFLDKIEKELRIQLQEQEHYCEEQIALSVPSQQKSPQPSPYMPGTWYGLVKRANLA